MLDAIGIAAGITAVVSALGSNPRLETIATAAVIAAAAYVLGN